MLLAELKYSRRYLREFVHSILKLPICNSEITLLYAGPQMTQHDLAQ